MERRPSAIPFRPSAEQSALIRQLVERIVIAVAPLSQNEQRDYHADAAATIGQLDKVEPTWLVIATALLSIRDALSLQTGGFRSDLMSSIDWVTQWAGRSSASEADSNCVTHVRRPLELVSDEEGIYRARISGGWLIADRVPCAGTLRAVDVRFEPDKNGQEMK
jgi:hypothetical protein